MPRGRKSANTATRPVARTGGEDFLDADDEAVDARLTSDDVRELTGRNSLASTTRTVHCSDESFAE